MKPTDALYQSLETAYEHFNQCLFKAELPDVIFTVQRQKGVLGYFAPDRWTSVEGKQCHEIAINPTHIGKSRMIDVLETLVHEMVHCWQYCFGKPGRRMYHNMEWANKMIAVGLQPTSTGKPGGSITGESMTDYPIKNGPFLNACHQLLSNEKYNIPWIDRLTIEPRYPNFEEEPEEQSNAANLLVDQGSDSAPVMIDDNELQLLSQTFEELLPEDTFYSPPESQRKKQNYECPSCHAKVWGKGNLNIMCMDCKVPFRFN
jgi:predicted SprT family Zn-dependent metalloprotease